jgi:hypothetical protein
VPPRFRTQQPLVEQAAELGGGKMSKLIRAALKAMSKIQYKMLMLCGLLVDLK